MLPDAKLHKPTDHIYFRRLLRACGFRSYSQAAKALGIGKRTVARYANDGGFSYPVQFYLEARAFMENEVKNDALLASVTRVR